MILLNYPQKQDINAILLVMVICPPVPQMALWSLKRFGKTAETSKEETHAILFLKFEVCLSAFLVSFKIFYVRKRM